MPALLIVVPIELVLVGVVGHGFDDPAGAPTDLVAGIDALLFGTLLTALVSASHARVVVLLADGNAVTVGHALRHAVARFGPVLGAAILYAVLTAIGTAVLVLPGIYVAVLALFATTIAAVTNTGPADAITESGELVESIGWWRTFGYTAALALVGLLLSVGGALVATEAASALNPSGPSGWVAVALTAVFDALWLSWTALVTTLLYFAWRARAGYPFGDAADDLELRVQQKVTA